MVKNLKFIGTRPIRNKKITNNNHISKVVTQPNATKKYKRQCGFNLPYSYHYKPNPEGNDEIIINNKVLRVILERDTSEHNQSEKVKRSQRIINKTSSQIKFKKTKPSQQQINIKHNEHSQELQIKKVKSSQNILTKNIKPKKIQTKNIKLSAAKQSKNNQNLSEEEQSKNIKPSKKIKLSQDKQSDNIKTQEIPSTKINLSEEEQSKNIKPSKKIKLSQDKQSDNIKTQEIPSTKIKLSEEQSKNIKPSKKIKLSQDKQSDNIKTEEVPSTKIKLSEEKLFENTEILSAKIELPEEKGSENIKSEKETTEIIETLIKIKPKNIEKVVEIKIEKIDISEEIQPVVKSPMNGIINGIMDESPKRKRGRPKKGTKKSSDPDFSLHNTPKKRIVSVMNKIVVQDDGLTPKRKRGRPRKYPLMFGFTTLVSGVKNIILPSDMWKSRIVTGPKKNQVCFTRIIESVSNTSSVEYDRLVRFDGTVNYRIKINNRDVCLVGAPKAISSLKDIETLLEIVHSIDINDPVLEYLKR